MCLLELFRFFYCICHIFVDIFADLIRQFMYLRSHFIHDSQSFIKFQDCRNSYSTVNCKPGHNNAKQHYTQNMWNHCYAFVNNRVKHIHDKGTCKSPVDRKFQAHIPMQIKRLIAVIPPFIVKHFF